MALLATSQQEPVLERYFPLAYRRKKRGQIEVNFELLHHLWQGERALRGQEALLRNDAAMVTRVWREFEVKVSSAQKRRDYLMQQLTEEEE